MTERPKYGWYVKNIIIGLFILSFIGLVLLIAGLMSDNLLRYILIFPGIISLILFLWPAIGMTVMNLTLNNESYVEDEMKALDKIDNPQILDIGCGTGRTAIKIAKKLKNGGHLTGIDIYSLKEYDSKWSIEKIRSNARLEGVSEKTTFKNGSATDIPFGDDSFDIVNLSSVLHEIHDNKDLNKALREIYRVLKRDGYLYIGEWNRNSWRLIGYMGIFSFVFKPSEHWKVILRKNGFSIEEYNESQGFGTYTAFKS